VEENAGRRCKHKVPIASALDGGAIEAKPEKGGGHNKTEPNNNKNGGVIIEGRSK
jgi:hypothetical protein